MADSPGDRGGHEGWPRRPDMTADRSSAGPMVPTGESTDGGPTARVDSMSTTPSVTSFSSKARAVAIAGLIGVPAIAFLAVITWGAILTPLAGLLLLAPFVAVNYLLWGRLLAPGKPAGGRPGVDAEAA